MIIRRLAVVILLMTSACLLFANPFIGQWTCDTDRYWISATHISGIMDGSHYESDYTYTDRTWVWKDRTWVYLASTDGDWIMMVSIMMTPSGVVGPRYWIMKRAKASPKENL